MDWDRNCCSVLPQTFETFIYFFYTLHFVNTENSLLKFAIQTQMAQISFQRSENSMRVNLFIVV